jgi:MOSC domain-containing protein YiiM
MEYNGFMKIISLNIGLPKEELFGHKVFQTAIAKQSVSGPVKLGHEGFKGDGSADRKNHGGADKAVCVYPAVHYPYWSEVLGIKLPDAAFGENLTVAGLTEEDVSIGDVFAIGTAICQVTQPRQPCNTLNARYGRPDLGKLVVESGKTGFYLRVLQDGEIASGDRLVLTERGPGSITIAHASHVYHHDRRNVQAVREILALAALSTSWRESFEKFLKDAEG